MNIHPCDAHPAWSGVDWAGTDFDDLEFFDLSSLPSPSLARPDRSAPRRPASRAPRPSVRPLPSRPSCTAPARPAARVPVPRLPASSSPLRSVLLIDLENVCSGSSRPGKVLAQLQRLLETAGPVDEVLAVASSRVLARQRLILARAGIPTRSVRSGPDAADREIVAAAREYAARGATVFHVASADHFFVRVARLGALNVITVPGRPVSARLADAAASVSVAA